jgi:acyl dehydratase
MSFFEDIRVGERTVVGRHTFTAEDIKSFAQRYDPQSFHVDEDAAARSHFGALCASGWHSAIVFMRLMLETRRHAEEQALGRGERVALTGPALGVRDLKWLRPVYAGDTLEYVLEVIELRVSKSRPRYGLMTIRTSGINQKGELAISFLSTTFVERRAAE